MLVMLEHVRGGSLTRKGMPVMGLCSNVSKLGEG